MNTLLVNKLYADFPHVFRNERYDGFTAIDATNGYFLAIYKMAKLLNDSDQWGSAFIKDIKIDRGGQLSVLYECGDIPVAISDQLDYLEDSDEERGVEGDTAVNRLLARTDGIGQ